LAVYLVAQELTLVSPETVRRHLHRLGYRVTRPVLTISSPDPEYQAKVQYLQACQEQARQGKLVLLYQDEFDLNLLPGVIRCWTRRGEQRKVPTPGQNVKRYGFGAVNFLSGQLTHCFGERKNSDGFCALVEQIVREYCPGEDYTGPKVAIVVDNYIIHRSKKTRAVLEQYTDRLLVVPLPSYAPKLNVIELLWKHLRRRVTHNHLFESMETLLEAADQFLRSLDQCRAQVLSIIGCSG
jgi:putative transposase